VALAAEEFLPEVARRIPEGDDPLEALRRMRISDLYLACGCLQGDDRAVAGYRSWCLPAIRAVLRRMDGPGISGEDIEQIVYLRVFVGADGRKPRIEHYAARGDLRKWLQTVAVRAAQNLLRKNARERPVSASGIEDLLASPDDPELGYIKDLYRDEFKQAFAEALEALTSKERNLLRYRLLENRTIQEIGRLHRVHRVTVTRWIADIRAKLLEETRLALARRLSTGTSEVDSIVDALRSQLDASVRRFIA
jgi:RNA polymerase sigma-70 factor (ECF subfamily)